jgi:phage N-6-adenine-methyltransferase
MNTALMFSSGKDDWETPADLFGALHEEFGFTLDLAANTNNAKVPRWVGPGSPIAENLLAWEIPNGERCWMNPPYSRGMQADMIHTVANHAAGKDVLTVALLPARTDTRAFHWYIWNEERNRPRAWVREIRFLRGRLRFVGAPNAAPFPSMIVVFGRG